jgi:glycosyltransferase involved in cell wall biosynthesis
MAVLPNDIDLERFRPGSQEERSKARFELGIAEGEALVLSVHRLSPVRRTLTYLPTVFKELPRRHKNVRFVLAGGGPEEADVRRAISRLRVDDRVQLLGAVPNEHIRYLYMAADVFMMPSYTEGFPRVLLEAMAMGVPIASTDVGGVREILPSAYHGRLADRGRPLQLVRAVDELLREPAAARDLAIEGRQWVRRFDSVMIARELVDLSRE